MMVFDNGVWSSILDHKSILYSLTKIMRFWCLVQNAIFEISKEFNKSKCVKWSSWDYIRRKQSDTFSYHINVVLIIISVLFIYGSVLLSGELPLVYFEANGLCH